ncbi:nucleotidyltransferase family protein [Amylibacter sp.]|nr:nucleotidyltransferase family protein [Amylibacter sp.]
MLKFKLTPAQQFLCLCIRHVDFLEKDKIQQMYESIGDEFLFSQAKLNGVSSIIGHALFNVLGEYKLPYHWLEEYKEINEKISSYMNELEKVASLLDKNDIQLLALKNSGIAKGLYPHYGSCPMGDVDVLVSQKVFRKAHAVLSEAGYQLKFRSPLEEDNIESAERGGGAEYSVTLDNGEHLWFELQWRPVAGRWIQPMQEPKVDDLIKRSKPIINSKVRLLSPEDNLIQVALHTAKHSFVRAPGFRLHTDVDRIATAEDIDWATFTSRVCELKAKTAVYISLEMARTLLGTKVPEDVLSALKPNNLKIKLINHWLEKVGIFEPDAPKWSKPGFIIFVSLLYDDIADLLDGIFPSSKQMKEDHDFSSSLLLPYYHGKRILNLLTKRTNT